MWSGEWCPEDEGPPDEGPARAGMETTPFSLLEALRAASASRSGSVEASSTALSGRSRTSRGKRMEIWLPVVLEPSVNSLPFTSQMSASGALAAGCGGAQSTQPGLKVPLALGGSQGGRASEGSSRFISGALPLVSCVLSSSRRSMLKPLASLQTISQPSPSRAPIRKEETRPAFAPVPPTPPSTTRSAESAICRFADLHSAAER
mmetsp:Transcript_63084/g.124710  ORF Transcript_63084/g.124710 Transcript_63084/m.124710 type:complete len:205 (-) Transcript_63084:1329-1943(-)